MDDYDSQNERSTPVIQATVTTRVWDNCTGSTQAIRPTNIQIKTRSRPAVTKIRPIYAAGQGEGVILEDLISGLGQFWQDIFPNGDRLENKGYVSIELHIPNNNCYFKGTCIVSLLDSGDTKRFSQTYEIPYPTISPFIIEKFISRKLLLNDPDDLCPNGILTIMTQAWLTVYPEEYNDYTAISNLNILYHLDDDQDHPHQLLLDSRLAKKLAEHSKFFRAISDMPMAEKITKLMPIPKEEFAVFRNIALLVMGICSIEFYGIEAIFDMYIVADKYDIPIVSETCVYFLKLVASIHGIEELFKRIDNYAYEGLKELLETQIKSICKSNLVEETKKTDKHVWLKEPVYGHIWVYVYSEKLFNRNLRFQNIAKKHSFRKERQFEEYEYNNCKTDEYDFYK